MPYFNSPFNGAFERVPVNGHGIDEIRDQMVNWAITACAVVGAVGVMASVSRAITFGWRPLAIMHSLLWILTLILAINRNKLSHRVKSFLILFILYTLAIGGFLTLGLSGHAAPFLIVCAVLSTILLGLKYGVATIVAGLGFVALFGFAVNFGWYEFNFDFNAYASSPQGWTMMFWAFAFESAILVGCLGYMYKSLVLAIDSVSKSESNFRAVFNDIHDAIFIHDAYTGEVLDVNDRMCEMFGYSKEEFMEMDPGAVSEGNEPYTKEEALEWIRKTLKQGPQLIEWRSRDKWGRLFWTGISLKKTVINGREVVLGVIRDISAAKDAEQSMHQSEAKFRALSEASFESIFLSEKGICIGQNLTAKNMFGYSDEEVIGRPGTEWIAPDHKKTVMENMIAGYDSAYEAEALRKDGSTFPCEIRGKTIKYGDREVRVTALRDLTRRKETEDALKKSRQNYKTLIEALTEAFGIQDENGLITYVNKKQLELLGYREEEMLGRPFIDFMDEKSREISKAEFGRRIQGVSGAYEINMVRKDGRVVNVIISAKPLFDDEGIFKGSFGVATDITARKKMEEALKESENRLTLALEGAALGLWDWNLKTGKAVWIDRNVTMLGYCSDEVKQDFKTWKSMVHPDDWPEVSKRLNDHIKGKTELFEAEYRIRNKAGNWQWTQSRGKTVELDENGDPVRMAGVVVDIDETKRTEMELEKTKALLLAAVEQSPAGILIADAPEVRIRLANSAALGIRGESEKSLTDIPLESHPGAWNTFHMSGNICEPEDLPLSRAILYGETVKNKELTIRRNDGESRTVLANASPVRDAEGNVVAGVVVFPDITDRKNAEKALLQSERRLRMALEHMPALLVAFDHNNHIVVANEACERVTGYSRDEIINNPQVWEALYSGENGTGASKGLEALDGDFINKELSLLGKDGEKKTISWSNISNEVPIPGWSSWAIGIDVTEMRLAENALKESETRYRTLFSYMREGVALHKILYNENGEPEDYMVTDVNFAFESITGISREKAIGAKGSELYGTGEAPFLEEYAQVADSGSFWKRDIYWRKMRKHFSVSAFSPGPGAFATVFTDITEQKEAEKNLSRTMAQLNGLLENMPDYVHFKDTQRRHVFVNRALEDFLGLPRERIIGARIEDFYQKGLNDDSSSTDQRIIEGEDLIRFEHESVNAKGELRLLDTVKFRILNDQGHFIGIGGLTRDVTDSKRLERQLLQSQKMEAIGTLAGGIAHDFNNLLQVIQGYADVASFKLDNERPLSNELSEIKKAAKTAAELTRGLLTFSRRLESKLKPVNLNRELENLVNMLKRTLPKSIEISFTPDEALGIVKADPAQMQQVIMNLAVNARDAMPEGGTLSIQTENTFLDEQYCKTNLDVEPGDYTLVTVSDTGLGMDRNTAKHIFDPFFTTKDLGQGTGLGLAIVYGIVKNHRGAILCYSEPDMGTTFRIYLPVVIEESETAPERDHRNLPGGDETILLVDDEEAILENGRVLLSNYGYEILTANNGRQALEIYRDRSKEISLIVLDLIMPEMDGKTCLEEILKINPLEKVIIASGYAANGIMDETMDLGAKASIKKPFESGKILELIRAVIDEGELPETTL